MAEYPGLHAEFQERFRLVNSEAYLRAEREVIGGDYGASSYTTVSHADELAGRLHLSSNTLLLDIGSGPGWPGAYLSSTSGARSVLTDPTTEGMAVARARSQRDHLDSHQVVAVGGQLPFPDETFDAATCSDVFC